MGTRDGFQVGLAEGVAAGFGDVRVLRRDVQRLWQFEALLARHQPALLVTMLNRNNEQILLAQGFDRFVDVLHC